MKRRVVVTGMGVISPIGNDLDTFAQNLMAGQNGIDLITKFDTTDYAVKIAAEVKDFDVKMWMDGAQAKRTDLYAQYAIAAAVQAMAHSGLEGNIAPERFGVYVGSGIGGIQTLIEQANTLKDKGPRRVSPLFVPMMISNMAAGLIAMRFQAMGPVLPVVTACATGTHSIGEALRSIQNGYADAILAGGAEAAVNGLAIAGFCNSTALSTKNDINNASIPFDKRRDGFVMGEGAGVLVLEEYDHAKARGANIFAELVGYGNTCDAYHMTAPHPEALSAGNAIALALKDAGDFDAAKLYINAHGTSTPLNDKLETIAIRRALGDDAQKAYVSSTKSMTGHMLGAAGAVEAIASILALQQQTVPPNINYQEPDEECNLNLVVNTALQTTLTHAASTSLGFGGHNACIVFQKGGN